MIQPKTIIRQAAASATWLSICAPTGGDGATRLQQGDPTLTACPALDECHLIESMRDLHCERSWAPTLNLSAPPNSGS